MAFPAVRSRINTDGTTASATPVVNLPATIAAGDVLFVVFRVAVAGVIGWPAGWNELFDASPDASDDQMAAAWRKADGTEGASITLSCTSGKFCAIAYAISGSEDPNVRPPELSTAAIGDTPNHPNATTCTPTGGAKDYLWLTFWGMEGEQTGVTTYPTSYTLGQSGLANSSNAGAVTTNVTMAGAAQQLNAASQDAGVWAIGGTLDSWTAYTIAFHPGTPVASPGRSKGIGRVAQRRIQRSSVTVASLGLMALIVNPPPPGQQAQGIPARHGRVVVSTQTLPPDMLAPPGQSSQRRPAQRPPRRPTWIQGPAQPIIVVEALPPGQQVQGSPPQRVHPRPWAIGPAQPIVEALPPGQNATVPPALRVHPRPWSVSAQLLEALPPGETATVRPAQRAHPRPWSVSPRPPEPLPPGRTATSPPAQRPSTRGWVNTQVPPVVEAFPPGQRSEIRPPSRPVTRGWAVITPPPPPQELPVGDASQIRPPIRPAVRGWSVSPGQPAAAAEALPPGQRSFATPATHPRRRSWAIRAQLQDTRLPGQTSVVRPPQRPRTLGFTVSRQLVEALPPGKSAQTRPPVSITRRSWSVSPAQPAPQAVLPPGEQSSVRPAQRDRPRAWSVSPAQPASQVQPVGRRAIATPAIRPPRGATWIQTPDLPPPQALPPGESSQTRPPVRPATRGWSVSPAVPVVVQQAFPPGQTAIARPAMRPPRQATWIQTPVQPPTVIPPTPPQQVYQRRWLRRAPHLTESRKRVFHQLFQLSMETGIGDTLSPTPEILLRWSSDGGHTWHFDRSASAGPKGQYTTRVRFQRLGQDRDRVYEVSSSSPVKVALIAAVIRTEGGGS